MAEEKKTVADLVDALGGTFAVGDLLGIEPTAVSNAKAQNWLPERWRWKLSTIMRARRISISLYRHLLDAQRSADDPEIASSNAR